MDSIFGMLGSSLKTIRNGSEMISEIFDLRRQNLRRIVLEKFDGNRSAFGRATKVNPNQVNLLLSDNAEHKRNLGEDLARKFEAALKLPQGFFDLDDSLAHSNSEGAKSLHFISTEGLSALQVATIEALACSLKRNELTDAECVQLLGRLVPAQTRTK